MTREELRAAMDDVIYCCACMVNGEKPDAARAAGMEPEAMYPAAKRHQLAGIVGCALEAAGVYDPAFRQEKAKAVRKIVLLDAERAAVLAELEKAGIWYLPLKGCVLKDLYPAVGMRQMADNDILIDASRCEEVRKIMESLGFETGNFGKGNHDSYFRPPVSRFEMHRALFSESLGGELYEYYRNVKDRLIKDEGNSFGFHFSPEDFYVYLIAHEYKHFSNSGTGLRSILDTYVYLQNVPLDMDYVAGETDTLGIAGFEAANRSLAQHLFGGEELTDEDREMLEYILSSGTYGTLQNRVKNKIAKNGGSRSRYMLQRLCVPVSPKDPNYQAYAAAFPRFYKNKLLLPLLPVYRACRAMKNGRLRTELRAVARVHKKSTNG